MKRTTEIEDEICKRLAEGEPLRAICRDEHMPSWQAVYQWMDADEDFARRIAHARNLGHDAIAESALEIADDGRNDWMDRLDKDQVPIGYQLNGDHVQRSKLRIETRLKLLAKWNPKKYGERTAMELTGANGGPVQMTDTEAAAKLAGLIAAARARKDDLDGLL
jgi:hypothetical protein